MFNDLIIYWLFASPLIIALAMWLKTGLGCLMGLSTAWAVNAVIYLNPTSGFFVLFASPFLLVMWDMRRLFAFLSQQKKARHK